jgi:hypothetical protein
MQWLRTVRNGGKLYLKSKSTTDCSAREEEEDSFWLSSAQLQKCSVLIYIGSRNEKDKHGMRKYTLDV